MISEIHFDVDFNFKITHTTRGRYPTAAVFHPLVGFQQKPFWTFLSKRWSLAGPLWSSMVWIYQLVNAKFFKTQTTTNLKEDQLTEESVTMLLTWSAVLPIQLVLNDSICGFLSKGRVLLRPRLPRPPRRSGGLNVLMLNCWINFMHVWSRSVKNDVSSKNLEIKAKTSGSESLGNISVFEH